MDFKILILICYYAVSPSESYYAPPDDQNTELKLNNGNRRFGSDILTDASVRCVCYEGQSSPTSLEQNLDPYNNGLQRLVVYLYQTPDKQTYIYIPNREKQTILPSLELDLNDVFQPYEDNGILQNNNNNAIYVKKNKSPQPVSNTYTQPVMKVSSPNVRPVKNVASNNFIQNPNPFAEPQNYNQKIINSNDEKNAPTKPPSKHFSDLAMTPPLQTPIKRENPSFPSTIGFKPIPFTLSPNSGPKLNLSKIVPDKNTIIHVKQNNQPEKAVLKPQNVFLPHSDGENGNVPLIGKLNMIPLNQNVKPLVKNPDLIVEPSMTQNPEPSQDNDNADPVNDPKDQNSLIKIPTKQARENRMFSDWFNNEIARQNQNSIETDTPISNGYLVNAMRTVLGLNKMYISREGYLVDVNGNLLRWDFLKLRSLLLGDPMDYETVVNSPDPINFKPGNAYSKALLMTYGTESQSRILGIIPMGKTVLRKSDVKFNVTIDSHICKSGNCQRIVPARIGDEEMITSLQKYMPTESSNRRNLGIKLNPPSLQIFRRQDSNNRKKNLKKNSRKMVPDDFYNYIVKSRPVQAGSLTMKLPFIGGGDDEPNQVLDWRIIGGAAATSSGAPLSVRGRSSFMKL